jgi:Zn-dependent alcohol dehydrogenase
MSQTVRGVISRSKKQPVELVDIVIPAPGPGEVVVNIIACGVCHTDLTYREGGINDQYPFLLGHEAAGTIESVGEGVTNVEPGDFVILNWRAVCWCTSASAPRSIPMPIRLNWAREFGATHTVNVTWKQAFYARDLAGTVVLVGVPTPDMTLEMPLVDFFSRGGSLKSSWYGDCLPERDFPTLISLYLQGRLPLDKFVSERIGLEDVESAFHRMHSSEVLRSVVVVK